VGIGLRLWVGEWHYYGSGIISERWRTNNMFRIYRNIEIDVDFDELIDDLSNKQLEELIECLVDRELVVKVEEDSKED
jgi:hypothetical protein